MQHSKPDAQAPGTSSTNSNGAILTFSVNSDGEGAPGPDASGAEHQQANFSMLDIVRTIWEYVWTLSLMALIVFSCRSSLADWYEVPSGSMLPTIQLGDRIFVNKLAYDLRMPFSGTYIPFLDKTIPYKKFATLGEPKRGDIVVFVYPEDNRTDYVKRLVGLPGDRIEVRANILYINGVAMPREVISQDELPAGAEHDPEAMLYKETIEGVQHFVFEKNADDYGPTSVPDGMYFMMGDNRDNSSDSRAWGFVPAENLRGRALRVVLSFDPRYSIGNPNKLRFSRFMQPLNP